MRQGNQLGKSAANETNGYKWFSKHPDKLDIAESYEDKIKNVKTFVCEYYDITLEILHKRTQAQESVNARYICYFILVDIMSIPNQYVCYHFDYNNATVCRGRDVIKNQLQWDTSLNYFITECFIKC